MGVYNCSTFCCTLLHVHSSIAIILIRKKELVALLSLSSWCLVMVMWYFLAVPCICLQFVIVAFPNHAHLLLFTFILHQGLLKPEFYGDLVYKLKKIVGSNNFSAQFIKIISHYKKIGYNINVLQQTVCLVVNQITVGNFSFLLNYTLVGQTQTL